MLNFLRRYQGHFEGVSSNGYAKGWLQDRRNTNTPVTVVLLHNNTVVREALADIYRPDLENAGYGHGRHGFCIKVPYQLLNHTDKLEIATSNKAFRLKAHANDYKHTLDETRYKGACEKVKSATVRGWVVDSEDPDAPLEVAVFDGDTHLLSTNVNLYRGDLGSAGVSPGNHGFSFELPRRFFDGKPHILTVKVKGEDAILTNCPMHLDPRSLAQTLSQSIQQRLDTLSERYQAGKFYGR